MDIQKFKTIAKLLRYYSLLCTTTAGSGHPTSALSAADLMAVLYFNFFKYDSDNPDNLNNDRLIFSKGHATPLLYALYKVAGKITEEELLTYRQFGSRLEGHPTPDTPYTDVATGSLGMGLSFGLGMALASKMDGIDNKIYVLLGDGEMAEGNVWEAIQSASYHKVHNLIGIIDVNRLGQTGETMLGHQVEAYEKRIKAFDWHTIIIDGHNYDQIMNALIIANNNSTYPTMIIAKTLKGKGVSLWEDKNNWHSKQLSQEQLTNAISELHLEQQDHALTFPVNKPNSTQAPTEKSTKALIDPQRIIADIDELVVNSKIASKTGYGIALQYIAENDSSCIVLDGDVGNSTNTHTAQKNSPNQFLNLFIAEQNMLGVGVGLSKADKTVHISTFGAFLTRAYDQIRIAALSQANIKINGSYAGVSLGMDGPSQMGLEDIAMMRAVFGSTIVHPADSIAAIRLTEGIHNLSGISYIRTVRESTPNIYTMNDTFPIGGSKVLKSSNSDHCTIIAAGITVHEALKAYEILQKEGVQVRVIDCYSIKPIDDKTLVQAAQECHNWLITVEDHYSQGGLGDAVLEVFAELPGTKITKMAITKRPHSGKGDVLLDKYGISAQHLVAKIRESGKI